MRVATPPTKYKNAENSPLEAPAQPPIKKARPAGIAMIVNVSSHGCSSGSVEVFMDTLFLGKR